ncbi:MAG: hypothetical protein U0800_14840 [Isosphaeraceae bacterium]
MKAASSAARELGDSFTRAHEAWLRVLSSISVELLASRLENEGDRPALANFST